jgi:predicted transposase/invertase (TIGR01784 family)
MKPVHGTKKPTVAFLKPLRYNLSMGKAAAAKLEYTFKTDTLFKMLFVKHTDLLKQLVSGLLGIRLESIGEFHITNPEMPPESLGDKFCRLDINMTVNGQRVDLEIQIRDEGDYPERALYHWAREYSTALPAGGDYINLPRTVIISIINFNLFDCDEYYSEFQALETTRHTPLTDKMGLYFYELNKLPNDVTAGDMRLLWLMLFKAETEEELAKIESMEVPVMEEAIRAYHQITADSEFREMERLRELARHNEAAALRHARNEGEARGEARGMAKGMAKGRMEGEQNIINLLKSGKSPEEVIKLVGNG